MEVKSVDAVNKIDKKGAQMQRFRQFVDSLPIEVIGR